jgi:hypothetical protein
MIVDKNANNQLTIENIKATVEDGEVEDENAVKVMKAIIDLSTVEITATVSPVSSSIPKVI